MTQPAPEAEPEPRRAQPAGSKRDYLKDTRASRLRGARRGLLARYALRNLPPIEDDEP